MFTGHSCREFPGSSTPQLFIWKVKSCPFVSGKNRPPKLCCRKKKSKSQVLTTKVAWLGIASHSPSYSHSLGLCAKFPSSFCSLFIMRAPKNGVGDQFYLGRRILINEQCQNHQHIPQQSNEGAKNLYFPSDEPYRCCLVVGKLLHLSDL